MQMYRLNHMSVCISYNATLRLIQVVSTYNSAPLKQWIKEGVVLKFLGDNVDKQQKVRDLRSEYQGDMLHILGASRCSGRVWELDDTRLRNIFA